MFKKNKRGNAMVNYLINILIAVILLGALGGLAFTYLGTGATGLGNTTLYPDVPTWLPSLLKVVVAVGIVVLFIGYAKISAPKGR